MSLQEALVLHLCPTTGKSLKAPKSSRKFRISRRWDRVMTPLGRAQSLCLWVTTTSSQMSPRSRQHRASS
ncbi:hypothetical protein E2I00_020192 [Balaenoptera physalus]|uniref:Uncharacterized protein n=1 Tax=Balaenoptera physalus TaxID=9770 RepID=A0A643C6W1_BALPH|nr:hypothetical protein E2I00_020192 [Balaenoptera physalus]